MCYVDILEVREEDSINYFIIGSMVLHIAMQWCFSCFKCCSARCCQRSCVVLYRFWNLVLSLLTVLCIAWALVIYVLISRQIALEMDKLSHEERRGLVLATLAIFVQIALIFCFPFCWSVSRQVGRAAKCCPDAHIVSYHQMIRRSTVNLPGDGSVQLLRLSNGKRGK